MSARTLYEKVMTVQGYRFIRLKSGRMMSFWDAITDIERAQTDLGRAISRAFKLAGDRDDDYDLERLEYRIDHLEEHMRAVRAYLDKRRGNLTKRQRIALLRNTTGRTPEEAKEFLRKADELEAGLHDS